MSSHGPSLTFSISALGTTSYVTVTPAGHAKVIPVYWLCGLAVTVLWSHCGCSELSIVISRGNRCSRHGSPFHRHY